MSTRPRAQPKGPATGSPAGPRRHGVRFRGALAAASLGALATLFAACAVGSSPEPPAAEEAPGGFESAVGGRGAVERGADGAGSAGGGTLRVAVGEPTAIVPFEASTRDELLIVDTLFDGLTTYDEDLNVVPAAAERWSSSEDGRTWTFVLREGAAFHDPERTPVTAEDFAYAWDLAVTEGGTGHLLEDVEGYDRVVAGGARSLAGVTAVDERTLEVRLQRPDREFPAVVAHPALAPIQRQAWDADPGAYRERPVGNGAFKAAEALVRGQFLRVQRFEDWRNGPHVAALDEVLFQFMDPETAFVAFQQERLQVAPLPPDALDVALQRYGASEDGYRGPGVLHGPTPTVYFLAFNVTVPPFDDPEVRRAVSLAIDREAVTDAAVDAHVEPADSLVHPLLSDRPPVCRTCRHDPEQAAAVFEERDLGVLWLWFNEEGGHEAIAQQVRADLLAVGAGPILFETAPFAQYLEALEAGEAGWFRFGWAPEHATAGDVLTPLLHSRSLDGFNYMRYEDPEVDELLDRAAEAASPGLRDARYRQAEDLALNRDQVVVPLLYYRHHVVVSERVEGFVLNPLGQANLHEVILRRP